MSGPHPAPLSRYIRRRIRPNRSAQLSREFTRSPPRPGRHTVRCGSLSGLLAGLLDEPAQFPLDVVFPVTQVAQIDAQVVHSGLGCLPKPLRVTGVQLQVEAHRLLVSHQRRLGPLKILYGLADPATVQRYRAKVVEVPGLPCRIWSGAVTNRGHGRFWLTDPATRTAHGVIAHRFGYALAHGVEALLAVEVVAHACDNPLCQRPEH
ncbi:MAG TPA: hypothetical protein VHN80_13595 [Kineosporiaceae bacterium]|nr:hypothetical protein [Kineosporiaceae bacterium]